MLEPIDGGGYGTEDYSQDRIPDLMAESGNRFVAVYIQYRVSVHFPPR